MSAAPSSVPPPAALTAEERPRLAKAPAPSPRLAQVRDAIEGARSFRLDAQAYLAKVARDRRAIG